MATRRRHRLPKTERPRSLRVPMTTPELEALFRVAQAHGVTMTGWIRSAVAAEHAALFDTPKGRRTTKRRAR